MQVLMLAFAASAGHRATAVMVPVFHYSMWGLYSLCISGLIKNKTLVHPILEVCIGWTSLNEIRQIYNFHDRRLYGSWSSTKFTRIIFNISDSSDDESPKTALKNKAVPSTSLTQQKSDSEEETYAEYKDVRSIHFSHLLGPYYVQTYMNLYY